MFDINDVIYNKSRRQYICRCRCSSSGDAESIYAKYLIIVRELADNLNISAEMYLDELFVVIESNDKKALTNIVNCMNKILTSSGEQHPFTH